MGWTWAYTDSDAKSTGTSSEFANQADAETWIGEEWRGLLEAGVESVTLMQEGREVYGPMSLRPAD